MEESSNNSKSDRERSRETIAGSQEMGRKEAGEAAGAGEAKAAGAAETVGAAEAAGEAEIAGAANFSRVARDSRDVREPRAARDSKDVREPREARAPKEPREAKEARDSKGSRDPKAPKEGYVEFEEYLKKSNLANNTLTAYSYAVRQYFSLYEKVNKRNLQGYKVYLLEHYKPKTVNLRIRAMNCYLESTNLEKYKIPSVKVQQKTFLENVISQADYEYFKTCLKNDGEWFWYFVIRFMAATGARVSELIQIKVEHVRMGYLDLYSKGGKIRRIYIPQALQKEALCWVEERKLDSGFIFLNRSGVRITTRGISGQLKKLAQRYGIDAKVVYPHSFRHRFAKNFLERFQDIALLADLMGHESIETTRIYLRRTSSEQQTIVNEVVDW